LPAGALPVEGCSWIRRGDFSRHGHSSSLESSFVAASSLRLGSDIVAERCIAPIVPGVDGLWTGWVAYRVSIEVVESKRRTRGSKDRSRTRVQ